MYCKRVKVLFGDVVNGRRLFKYRSSMGDNWLMTG
jgi:hypothetical protein